MSVALSVNLNKIALIRNSRPGNYPDVVAFGRSSLDAGADGLTVHPRPDQRHIRTDDVSALAELMQDYPGAEFNIEGNPLASANTGYPGFMSLVEAARPHQCTLVPDSVHQSTSDHGFDLLRTGDTLQPVIQRLQDVGIRVSLFMDPDPVQIKLAADLGADRIELYTGPYASAFLHQSTDLDDLLEQYRKASVLAESLGLGVNAGHDLSLTNLPRFLTTPYLKELSIGHALTVDALLNGWKPTLHAYLTLCRQSSAA